MHCCYPAFLTLALTLPLLACSDEIHSNINTPPDNISQYSINYYRANNPGTNNQDLFTAGLGKTGLAQATPPTFIDPLNPTAQELRRYAIYSNYRAMADMSSNGGYGRLYGPNIDNNGNDTLGEGLIPGVEYLAIADDGSGQQQVTIAVQIPDSFNVNAPCIVAAPSSGSRGVYGAMATSAEWGLKHGCAVALTDSGKGIGLFDLQDDSVNLPDGTRSNRTQAASHSNLTPQLNDSSPPSFKMSAQLSENTRNAFNTTYPNRVALKHAHSQQNPEKDWGSHTLNAIRYALYALNQQYGSPVPPGGERKYLRYTASNTLILAASVSNGGAAVLRATEQDSKGLIDGVVAGEPSAQPASISGLSVRVGGVPQNSIGKPLLDYMSFANLYQPCAALAPAATLSESSWYNYLSLAGMNQQAANRCSALATKGLLSGNSLSEQASDALQQLHNYGYSSLNDSMHNAHYGLGNAPIIAMMYSNAYGRFSVTDNLCGMSAAAVNTSGNVIALPAALKAQSFALGNGTANGQPASVVYNDSLGGAKAWQFAISPSSTQADFALDAALCQRALVTGQNPITGTPLNETTTPTLAQSQAVQQGMRQVLLNGNLRGKPALIISGRNDALLPINHAARAYIAYNHSVEGDNSQLRYIEVENAQHFDGFLSLPGFDSRFIPLNIYFNRALDAMYAHLQQKQPLPPSQVVRTTARGGLPGAAPALQANQLPSLLWQLTNSDVIEFINQQTLSLPN
ncbi:D-(-)-3-hydroxybutyrate oligomer hydrolase [Neisseriaceae bacterium TC5R-5]|nr:D-(-)-3-hydroxybutyrate oligomer hydrolase [Neisseriaceae bacterium TC5R-5]